jgi:hypothetical protein
LVVRHNYSFNNTGDGLWTDINNMYLEEKGGEKEERREKQMREVEGDGRGRGR